MFYFIMARRRAVRSIKPKKQRGKGYFSNNAYNNYAFDYFRQPRRTQRGGFLSRYDLSYIGRDSVNQAVKHLEKLAPQLINQTMNRAQAAAPVLLSRASHKLDKVAAKCIDQIAQRTGGTLQKIAPDIIGGTIEELYKTPFRLLGRFGRKKYKELKSSVFKRLKIKR